MKKSICMILCIVLLFGTMSQAIANDEMRLEEVSAEKTVKPIAYTHDFDGYGNVVGVLNSDGTKTAYLFSTAEQAKTVEAITQLAMPEEFKLQQNSAAQTRGVATPSIVDAPVYSDYPDTNYRTSGQMVIGEVVAGYYGRTYMRFDMSTLVLEDIAYTDILSASLHLTESEYIEDGARNVIQAYFVKESWSEASVTWNTRPDYYGLEMLGCCNAGYDFGVVDDKSVDHLYVTKAVMAWLQGMDNNGILLKEKDDKYESCFYTANHSDVSKRPYLTVTYSDVSDNNTAQGINNNASYYVKNKKTGKYLTALTNTTGTQITQQEFRDDYATTQQWKFTQTSGAVYRISLGTTNRNLKNSAGTLGSNILLGTVAATTAQTWKVFRNWNGTYRFQSQLSPYGSIKATQDVTNIIQHQYLCDFSHEDEWTLIPVSKDAASFFDFNYDGFNTTYGIETMKNLLQAIAGYNSFSDEFTNANVSVGANALQNNSMFLFNGHGEEGRVCFYNQQGNVQGNLVVSDSLKNPNYPDISIEDWLPNSLSKSQLVVLLSCLSGADAINNANTSIDENMTGRLYQLGTHSIVSYHKLIETEYASSWLSVFMTDIILGRSLKNGKLRADNHIYDDYYMNFQSPGQELQQYPYGETNERHDLGDESFVPGFKAENEVNALNYSYKPMPSFVYENIENRITTLPKDVSGMLAPYEGHKFDVYMDEHGGIYWCYENTSILHSYEPYTENLCLGDFVVDTREAMQLAYSFLEEMEYDISGYRVSLSNMYSKDFTAVFYKPNTAIKLVFHMQADVSGQVHLNSFSAYVGDYDS